MTSFTNSPINYPVGNDQPIRRVKRNKAPTATDIKNFILGDEWLDTSTGEWFKFSNVPSGGVVWARIGGSSGDLQNLTGDSGGVVAPDAAGNIRILGSSLASFVGNSGSNSLTLTQSVSSYPLPTYLVGPAGQAGYQTIQSAINAVNAAGGNGTIYLKPGTYTENLTFPSTCNIGIVAGNGDESAPSCQIIGVHLPPSSGNLVIWRVQMTSATHIFNSSAAGVASLTLVHNNYSVNGYIFNVPNWAPAGQLVAGLIADRNSTASGFVNNTGGASVLAFESTLGVGTTFPMIATGFTLIEVCNMGCPIQITGSGASINFYDSNFTENVSLGGATTGYFVNSYCATGADAAITYNSSANTTLSNVVIDSTHNPAINGTSAGQLNIGSVTYMNNAAIAGTVTKTETSVLQSGTAYLQNVSFDHGTNKVDTNGELIIGKTGDVPQIATLTAGTNITITNGPGSITIDSHAGSQLVAYTSVNNAASPYTVLSTDYFLGVDTTAGPVTLNFPNTTSTGRIFVIKDVHGTALTSNITFQTPGGTVDFDGSVTYVINKNYAAVELLFDGAKYEVF